MEHGYIVIINRNFMAQISLVVNTKWLRRRMAKVVMVEEQVEQVVEEETKGVVEVVVEVMMVVVAVAEVERGRVVKLQN